VVRAFQRDERPGGGRKLIFRKLNRVGSQCESWNGKPLRTYAKKRRKSQKRGKKGKLLYRPAVFRSGIVKGERAEEKKIHQPQKGPMNHSPLMRWAGCFIRPRVKKVSEKNKQRKWKRYGASESCVRGKTHFSTRKNKKGQHSAFPTITQGSQSRDHVEGKGKGR